jgi:hypothetical protein
MLEQIENHGIHMHRAIENTSCGKHQVPKGIPCWHMHKNVEGAEGYYGAICGSRIRKAGFIGKISASSMRARSPKDDDPKNGARKPFNKKKQPTARSSHRENSK